MNKVLHYLFWLSLPVLFFVLFFHSNFQFDQDLGRHILTGKIIWTTGQIPKVNLFSYTTPDFHFINSHWLSQVLLYLVSNQFGPWVLTPIVSLVMSVVLTSTVLLSRKISKSFIASILAVAIFTPILLERTEVRPEVLSYLFAAIYCLVSWRMVVQSDKENFLQTQKLILILPLMQLIWTNSHIYFILGPAIFACAIFSIIISKILRKQKIKLVDFKKIIFVLVTISLACLFNPFGLNGALYPFNVFNNYGYAIIENQNIFYLERLIFNPNITYFKIALIAYLLSYLFRKYSKNPETIFSVVLLIFIVLPINAIRSFPFLFLINLVPFSLNLANFNFSYFKNLQNFVEKNNRLIYQLVVLSAICLNLLRIIRLIDGSYYQSIDSQNRFGIRVVQSGKNGVDFVLKNNLKGPIFNNFDAGGYLIYRMYPEHPVFVDNRPEAFPKTFFSNIYNPIQDNKNNFDQGTKAFGFNLVFFSHSDHNQNFLPMMIAHPDWQLVFLDPYCAIFVRKDANKQIAQDVKIDENNFKFESNEFYDNYMMAHVSSLFGWNRLMEKYLLRAYELNPKSKGIVLALADFYATDPVKQILSIRYRREYSSLISSIWF